MVRKSVFNENLVISLDLDFGLRLRVCQNKLYKVVHIKEEKTGLDEKGKMCSQRCPKSNVSSVKVPKESEKNIPYIGPLFPYYFLKVSL